MKPEALVTRRMRQDLIIKIHVDFVKIIRDRLGNKIIFPDTFIVIITELLLNLNDPNSKYFDGDLHHYFNYINDEEIRAILKDRLYEQINLINEYFKVIQFNQ